MSISGRELGRYLSIAFLWLLLTFVVLCIFGLKLLSHCGTTVLSFKGVYLLPSILAAALIATGAIALCLAMYNQGKRGTVVVLGICYALLTLYVLFDTARSVMEPVFLPAFFNWFVAVQLPILFAGFLLFALSAVLTTCGGGPLYSIRRKLLFAGITLMAVSALWTVVYGSQGFLSTETSSYSLYLPERLSKCLPDGTAEIALVNIGARKITGLNCTTVAGGNLAYCGGCMIVNRLEGKGLFQPSFDKTTIDKGDAVAFRDAGCTTRLGVGKGVRCSYQFFVPASLDRPEFNLVAHIEC